jgi:ADP-L-glycero-D-manno-heptose 6-epimerase
MQNKVDFDTKTILITGGAGFIGSNLAFSIQNTFPNSKIVIFDCFRNNQTFENGNLKSFGHYKNLIGFEGEIICGSIDNKSDLKLLEKFKFDFIFHQAAISDTRVYDQEAILRTNVNSFYDLLSIAKKDNATLIYASSAATYGNLPSPQTIGKECPDNPYGYSKYLMDNIAKKFSINNPHLAIVGLRFFNVYGPREYFKANTASIVIQLGHQILDGMSPRLFEGSDKIMRDFIYIDDVISAILKSCESKSSGIFNIGTGISRSFQDIADILQSELKTNYSTEYFQNPYDGYQIHTQADLKSTISNLGFVPKFSLEHGIKSYLPEIKRLHGTENK